LISTGECGCGCECGWENLNGGRVYPCPWSRPGLCVRGVGLGEQLPVVTLIVRRVARGRVGEVQRGVEAEGGLVDAGQVPGR
jgi:hypothetical protein